WSFNRAGRSHVAQVLEGLALDLPARLKLQDLARIGNHDPRILPDDLTALQTPLVSRTAPVVAAHEVADDAGLEEHVDVNVGPPLAFMPALEKGVDFL